MVQIEALDLDNACSLSELSCEDANVVSGGYVATLAATKNPAIAFAAYAVVYNRTRNIWLARAASLSTP